MGRRPGGRPGGILALAELTERHGGALEHDLLALGLDIFDIGTPRLTWGRLRRLLDEIPPTSHSALAWRLAEDQGRYPIDLEVQVAALDAARTSIWMQSKDGAKGRGRPKPTPRPNNGKTKSQLERIEERARRFRDRHRG